LAPAFTPASTPCEPSAFMTSTDQSPSSTSHVSFCVPARWVSAARMPCVVGGAARRAPAVVSYCASKRS
jgi:hypothetical protein